MIHSPIFLTFIAATILLLVFAFFIIYFTTRYRNSLIRHNEERQKLMLDIQVAKVEESERVMQQFSKHVHDNIGQMANHLRMNLHVVEEFNLQPEELDVVKKIVELADKLVMSSRSISHSLNSDIIKKQGLETSISNEFRFVNSLKKLKCDVRVSGYPGYLNPDQELVAFRIFQEALHNTLKYAEATLITVSIEYESNSFRLLIKDNGKGCDLNVARKEGGLGWINMEQRAQLLDAQLMICSKPGNGCVLFLNVKEDNKYFRPPGGYTIKWVP